MNEFDVNQPIMLRSWPNITRLAYIPDAMRLSAFLTKAPINLPMIYKMMRVELTDLLNFVAACQVTGLLRVQAAETVSSAHAEGATANVVTYGAAAKQTVPVTEGAATHSAQTSSGSQSVETAVPTQSARPKQSSSMLKRLLKKLTGK